MRIETIPCGAYAANAYLVYDEMRDDALLIDAGDDLDALEAAVVQCGKKLTAIVLTHGHFDHILAAARLRDRFGAALYIHESDAPALADARLNLYDDTVSRLPMTPCAADHTFSTADGDARFACCGFDFAVMNTPGHTPGGICLYDEKDAVLFTGDTLFADGFGRMDFVGGSMQAMRASLKRLLALPGDLTVYPGHGMSSTIARIRQVLH